jgi:hypothetical protein
MRKNLSVLLQVPSWFLSSLRVCDVYHCPEHCAQTGPSLAWCSAVAILELLITFEQKALYFPFTLIFTN